jgi:hypothetical protein
VGSGWVGLGVGCGGAVDDFAVPGAAWGVVSKVGSCVAAGVGSCTAVGGSVAGAFEGSGSVCEVCDSTVAAGVSGAEGVGVGVAAAATPGLRRAALGANFLPVVFSAHGLAELVPLHGTTHY